jgi:hypothetical protein
MKVVSAAPLLPRSSFSTCTSSSSPSRMTSWMRAWLGETPSAKYWREISLNGRKPWRSSP